MNNELNDSVVQNLFMGTGRPAWNFGLKSAISFKFHTQPVSACQLELAAG